MESALLPGSPEYWPVIDGCLRNPRLWREPRRRPSWMPRRIPRNRLPTFWYREPGLWLPLSCAVAFDAASSGYQNSTSVSWSHTCTGANLFGVIGINLYGASNDITSVTYNGVACASIASIQFAGGVNNFAVLYGIHGPATGAHNAVITRTSSNHIVAGMLSYTGVAQTGQPEASTTAAPGSSAANLPLTMTVTTDQAWLVAVMAAVFSGNVFANGTDCTLRQNNTLALDGIQGMWDSNTAYAPGSRTITPAFASGNAGVAGVGCVLAPAGAAAGNPWYSYAQQ